MTCRGAEVQINRRGDPDDGRANHRQERENRHERSPKQCSRNPRDQQSDRRRHSRSEPRHDVTAKRRVDDVLELPSKLAIVSVGQGRQHRELDHDRFAFDIEKIRRQKHEKKCDQQPRDPAHNCGAMPRDPAGNLLQDRQEQPLRAHCPGIESRNPSTEKRQSIRQIEPRKKLLRSARLHVLNQPVRFMDQRDGDQKERNHEEKRDAEKHDRRSEPRAIVHSRAQTNVKRMCQCHQNRAQENGSDERPDDAKRRPENDERDEAEENDAGEPPFRTPLERRVAG